MQECASESDDDWEIVWESALEWPGECVRESLKVRKSVRRLRVSRESACEGAPESGDWESVWECAS